jgi:hypothetical protein
MGFSPSGIGADGREAARSAVLGPVAPVLPCDLCIGSGFGSGRGPGAFGLGSDAFGPCE